MRYKRRSWGGDTSKYPRNSEVKRCGGFHQFQLKNALTRKRAKVTESHSKGKASFCRAEFSHFCLSLRYIRR